MINGYVEFHARSAFSFLEGASLPENMAARAAELGYPAMALLDRDGLYGAPRFHFAAKKVGLKAHIGAEVAGIPLIARNRAGYQNLCRLITRVKFEPPPNLPALFPLLEQFSDGLIALANAAHAETLCRIYGSQNVYVELQRHYHREEEFRNQAAIEVARRLKLPLLATNAPAYATPRERELLDVLTAIRHHVTIDQAGRLLARNSERYLKPARDMQRLFADLPEAIANTLELSSRLEFVLEDLGYEFPHYPVPEGQTMASFLRQRTYDGMRRRYGDNHARARAQIDRELALIEKLKLEGYFLIVWDIVEFCRREGILAQGRGSAANSAVCYALGITAVDPVNMDLLFERFLSEERREWPDIDLDLPSGPQRERVIQYVYERYGPHGAAMTANVITYRDRLAAREVGKALEPYRGAPKFQEICKAIRDLPRHLGQHSGGMVICQGRLDSIVPLQPASMPGRVVVQWDKDDCADLGLIKVDLLGLGMMAVLEESLVHIRRHYGESIDLGKLPQDDPAVYRALQEADTVGMFQVESRAQMATLPRVRPTRFYDLVVEVGIIRPGPIVGKMVHPYIRRRQGKEKPECLHPSLEPVLQRTLGVPLFQEQLLRMAMIAAGFSGGEAEELRRAFSHKRSEQRMSEIEVKLRRGMDRNGITGEVQDRIVQSITSFALYGFPESHAASFALLAYASAYLKVHYPAAFTAALLNCQPMGFYHPATIVQDARRHGLRFLPVDVNRSDWLCKLEKPDGTENYGVRLGLNYLSGLRREVGLQIAARKPYLSIDDLVKRVPGLRKDELATLADAGALNSLSAHRREALWEVARAARPAGPLLDSSSGGDSSPLAPMTPEQRLCADFQHTGLTLGRHPMAYRRKEWEHLGIQTTAAILRIPNGERVRVAGSVIVRQRPATAKGFVFLSLEDETGIANIILAPCVFEQFQEVIITEPYLFIEGRVQHLEGTHAIRAEWITPLPGPPTGSLSHDFH